MDFHNLDSDTRKNMAAEVAHDIAANTLYISPRLSTAGRQAWPELLQAAIANGNDTTLATSLHGFLNATYERRKPSGGYTTAKMPYDAPETLAEGEFNRFYIRALCIRAMENGSNVVTVYRAKQVDNPRPESQAKIGTQVDAQTLLNDLRAHPGVDTALGLPSGPNSGLSVQLVSG